jgi:hypothetical protein
MARNSSSSIHLRHSCKAEVQQQGACCSTVAKPLAFALDEGRFMTLFLTFRQRLAAVSGQVEILGQSFNELDVGFML